MKKVVLIFLMTAAFAIASDAQSSAPGQAGYVRPDAETRFKRYLKDTVGPASWVGRVAGSGFSTATNNPEEWGGTWKGFGKRVASSFGKGVIKNTVTYGLDEALKLDSHYYRSENPSGAAKFKNALLSPVTARKPNGKRTIGIPRIVGTYTSSIIANETWYPARYTWKDGLRSGTISLGTNALFNLVKEFVFKK